jgi:hypothetical protein
MDRAFIGGGDDQLEGSLEGCEGKDPALLGGGEDLMSFERCDGGDEVAGFEVEGGDQLPFGVTDGAIGEESVDVAELSTGISGGGDGEQCLLRAEEHESGLGHGLNVAKDRERGGEGDGDRDFREINERTAVPVREPCPSRRVAVVGRD